MRNIPEAGRTSQDTVVLRAHYPKQMEVFAHEMGLECKWTDKLIEKIDWVMNGTKLVVVGQDKSPGAERIKSIAREAEQIKLELKHVQEEKESERNG